MKLRIQQGTKRPFIIENVNSPDEAMSHLRACGFPVHSEELNDFANKAFESSKRNVLNHNLYSKAYRLTLAP